MIKQRGGHIAVVSSVAGIMAAPVSASYAMSKHALQVWKGEERKQKSFTFDDTKEIY